MENATPKNNLPNTREIKTDRMKVPAVFLTAQNIKEEIFEQIERVAENEKIFKKIAILSDAHLKKNVLSPEGTIVASEGFILPQMLDTALNCGMRIIKTDLHDYELTPEKIQALFLALQKEIPTKKYFAEPVPYYLAKRVLLQGSVALEKYYDFRIKNEISNTYANGNFFNNPLLKSFTPAEDEIFKIIPEIFVKMSRYRYGILGATDSHSITLSRVESILDQGINDMLMDIKEGQYILTMHTGSGIIGRYISYLYSPQKQKLIHKIPVEISKRLFTKEAKIKYKKVEKALHEFRDNPNQFGFAENSEEGRMSLQAYLMAGNIGFANRAMLSHKVDLILEKFFNRVVDLNLLYDAPHVFIDKERQDEKELFIHRNGAVRAQKYETVYVAPFMQTFGYIGVGTKENQETFFSANHEIGKIEDVDPEFLKKLSSENNTTNEVLILNKDGMKKVSSEIQHELYAETIAKEMEANKIFKIVAKIKPIAILTY